MVKVVIERHCKPEKDNEMERLLVEMRGKVFTWHAYLSGEVYRKADDPSVWVTIVTWLTLEGWKTWETSEERSGISRKIEPLLVEPERTSVLQPVF